MSNCIICFQKLPLLHLKEKSDLYKYTIKFLLKKNNIRK